MQMKFVAKTAMNLGMILTLALFASAQDQSAQGPPPSAAIATAAQPGPAWSPARSIDMFAFLKKTSAHRL
jgi:hypothetical protein